MNFSVNTLLNFPGVMLMGNRVTSPHENRTWRNVCQIGLSVGTHVLANAIAPTMNISRAALFGVATLMTEKFLNRLSPIIPARIFPLIIHASIPPMIGMLTVNMLEENSLLSRQDLFLQRYLQAWSLHGLSIMCHMATVMIIASEVGTTMREIQQSSRPERSSYTIEQTNLGASLIINDILSEAPDTEIEAFKNRDSTFFHFLMTKAIFLYSMGSKSHENIPSLFFKPATVQLIEALRNHEWIEILPRIEPFVMRLASFNQVPDNSIIATCLEQLKNIALKETRAEGGLSLLVSDSYTQALEQI